MNLFLVFTTDAPRTFRVGWCAVGVFFTKMRSNCFERWLWTRPYTYNYGETFFILVPVIELNNNFSFDIVIVSYNLNTPRIILLLHFLFFEHLFQSDKFLLIFQNEKKKPFIYYDYYISNMGNFSWFYSSLWLSWIWDQRRNIYILYALDGPWMFHKICHITFIVLQCIIIWKVIQG